MDFWRAFILLASACLVYLFSLVPRAMPQPLLWTSCCTFFFILHLSIMMPFCTSLNWLTSSRTCSSCWTSSIWILDLTGSAHLVAFHQFDLLSSCTYVPTSHQCVPVSQHLTRNLLSQAMSLEYPLPKVGWGSMQGLAWGSLVNESLAKIQNHKPIVLNKHKKVSLAKTLRLISCDKMQSWD